MNKLLSTFKSQVKVKTAHLSFGRRIEGRGDTRQSALT